MHKNVLTPLATQWMQIKEFLGLRLIAPYFLELTSGEKIEVDLLLLDFGAPKGMLLTTSDEAIWDHKDEIVKQGYGFSVLSEPEPNSQTQIDIDEFINMLQDWGWMGKKENEPSWLVLNY